MPVLEIKSSHEMKEWVRKHLHLLHRPCVVRLEGNLGAGKTQLVRWFCEALGVLEAASPTFAIHHEYPSPLGPIDHVDLYRLTSDEDLETSGFWDLLRKEKALLFVEWAGRLPADAWPADWTNITIELEKGEGEARRITWQVTKP